MRPLEDSGAGQRQIAAAGVDIGIVHCQLAAAGEQRDVAVNRTHGDCYVSIRLAHRNNTVVRSNAQRRGVSSQSNIGVDLDIFVVGKVVGRTGGGYLETTDAVVVLVGAAGAIDS